MYDSFDFIIRIYNAVGIAEISKSVLDSFSTIFLLYFSLPQKKY